jgi:hypothetical protein
MDSPRKPDRLRHLQQWHKRYLHMATSNHSAHWLLREISLTNTVLWEVETDELEYPLIEARILEMQGAICVWKRFCSECQHMLDNWPSLEPGAPEYSHSVRTYHTNSMEAAARNGCQFCACVLQSLRDSELLDLYRQVERRLEILEVRGTYSLSISEWRMLDARSLKLTLPGLENPLENVVEITIDVRGHITATESDSGMRGNV